MILHSIEQNPLKETITHFYFIEKEACMYNNLHCSPFFRAATVLPVVLLMAVGVAVFVVVLRHKRKRGTGILRGLISIFIET